MHPADARTRGGVRRTAERATAPSPAPARGRRAPEQAARRPGVRVRDGDRARLRGRAAVGRSRAGRGCGQATTQQSGPSALTQQTVLITAATALASDSDPARFANRPESRFTQHYMFDNSPWLGSFGNALSGGGLLYDKVVLRTFTYSSFVDSRQFFQAVPPSPPAAPGH